MWHVYVFLSTESDVALLARDCLCLRPNQPQAYPIKKITIELTAYTIIDEITTIKLVPDCTDEVSAF